MIVHHLWEYMCMQAMLNFHYSLVIEYIINIEGGTTTTGPNHVEF